MQNLPDQFGHTGRAQLQAQFDIAASLSTTAMNNAGRLALLQIEAARQWTLNAAEAWRHLFASAPLDWMSLPASWTNMFSYDAMFPQAARRGAPREPAGRAESPPPARAPSDPAGPVDAAAEAPEPPVPRTLLAAAAAEAVPGAPATHMASAFPPPGRAPLPKVKPMEAAPAPPQVAGEPPPSRGRGRGPKK